nr:zinc finger and BTB domain-containing protein 8A [Onthophagus taurus]
MYSLYRAWLSLTPNLAPPIPVQNSPLNLSGAGGSGSCTGSGNPQFSGSPDVILQVGPSLTEFSAHRTVLSAHSGFFKASLINRADPTPIVVPNVNVDEFSSLLTFMYTGYLDLNINNIYNILLATHILHMPRALELCRSFLMQNQPTTIENRTKLIKPIPSRKPPIPHQPIFPPIAFNLTKSEETPFKAVSNHELIQNQPSTSKMDVEIVKEKIDRKSEKSSIRHKLKNNDKVIIDVACCDGPVRFHRVLNKNYGNTDVENEYQIEKVNRNEAMNKLMNENINKRNDSEEKNSEIFTCLYCNHTFKSQYCYQKHARRHLNPVSLDSKMMGNEASGGGGSVPQKREVKPLDMNVQYYPCKTCGSKFPSYYFVHKHRKLCHAEEMADNNNKNNEIVAENRSQNSNDSGKTSVVIDVVETDDVK